MKKLFKCKIILDTVFLYEDDESNSIYAATEEALAAALKDYYFDMEDIHEIKDESDIPGDWLNGNPFRQDLYSGKELSTVELLKLIKEEQKSNEDSDYAKYLELKKKFENK